MGAVAEAVRFELTKGSRPRQFSRLVPSTARPRFLSGPHYAIIFLPLTALAHTCTSLARGVVAADVKLSNIISSQISGILDMAEGEPAARGGLLSFWENRMEQDQSPSRPEPPSHPGAEVPEHAGSAVAREMAPGTALAHPGDDALPGTPGTGEDVCQSCAGSGKLSSGQECPDCDGTGIVIQGIGGG